MAIEGHAGPVASALVVGGGVAGLTAAAALGARGIRVDVIDIREGADGTGIGLQNRGPDALEAVGALAPIVAAGAARDRVPVRFFDGAGALIADPGWQAREDGKPAYILVYRPLLARILRERAEAAGAKVRIGVTVKDLAERVDGVEVTLTDGTTATYDLVVGADGIRSQVRSTVFGDEVQPAPTGSIALRWVPRGIPGTGEAGFYYGPGAEMVVIPMHDDMTYVSVQHPGDQLLSDDEARSVLADKLAGFTAPYLREIANRLTSEETVLARRYERLLVDGPWHRGRVVLIGDAAHATTAQLGSGGVMALEDAVVLAEEVAVERTLEESLTSFGRRRFDRCRIVVDTSVRCSDMQAEGATAQEIAAVRGPALQLLNEP